MLEVLGSLSSTAKKKKERKMTCIAVPSHILASFLPFVPMLLSRGTCVLSLVFSSSLLALCFQISLLFPVFVFVLSFIHLLHGNTCCGCTRTTAHV